METGERWAYRARSIDPLVEVEVKRHGTQKPARVLVGFIGDDAEGREEWVPPARLKVRWSEVTAFEALEANWRAIETHPELRHAPEEYAADQVMSIVFDWSQVSLGGRRSNVACITDVQEVARRLDLNEADLRAAPESFEDDGRLVVPWRTVELIVLRVCELFPDRILRAVEEEEARVRYTSMHGEKCWSGSRSFFVEPERVAELDEEPYGRPKRDLIREWCGQEAIARRDELRALREEVLRVDGLLSEAIRTLREAGLKDQAASLEHRSGAALAEVRE
ncbi:hypothetical protein [Microbacterium esteraromaticum]|uniref:hypothetical protein n=1 Tax=Microbacterium esteraromaticum TaxID=57043 RepID=UPI001C957956|nr:hypothetical protein [Microbacterium esteraromaticum]MBY6061029.1 hypothetical protein [Microbacterium esteraromaticum]